MALNSACHRGDYGAIESLLKKGADPNEMSRLQRTPLIVACLCSKVDVEILRLLLAYGADPNMCGTYSSYSLSILLLDNNFDASKLLYLNGGRMPARESWYMTSWLKLHEREDVINFFTAPHKYISPKDISLNFTRLHSIRSNN